MLEQLVDTAQEVGRIQRGAPPLVADALSCGTRFTPRWRNRPFEAQVTGMKDHVLSGVMRGDGMVTANLGGEVYEVPYRTGTVTFVPRARGGEWRCPGSPDVSNVYLSPSRLEGCAEEASYAPNLELVTRVCFPDRTLFALLQTLALEAESREPIARLFVEQLLDLVCLQLLRAHVAFALPGDRRTRHGLAAWQVRRVIGYMNDNLCEDMGLQELANVVKLSRFHFCTAFRLATGYTPHEGLTRLRIGRARQLLADPLLRITDVALSVGYQTPSSFSAAFRRLVGTTPSEYRRGL
jgi:AraC-like DNA-binding protein